MKYRPTRVLVELTISDALFLIGTLIIIPTNYRQEILKQIHAWCFGLTKFLHQTTHCLLVRTIKWVARMCKQLPSLSQIQQQHLQKTCKPWTWSGRTSHSMKITCHWLYIHFKTALMYQLWITIKISLQSTTWTGWPPSKSQTSISSKHGWSNIFVSSNVHVLMQVASGYQWKRCEFTMSPAALTTINLMDFHKYIYLLKSMLKRPSRWDKTHI